MVCSKACAKQDDNAKGTGAEVANALGRAEAFNLKVSFRQALSFSTPPHAFYRKNSPGGHSNLIFGVPLVDHGTNEENIPKVMRMCIDEVEKRGLNVDKIYWVSYVSSHIFGFMLSDTEVWKVSGLYH
jgi:hypothetical protein